MHNALILIDFENEWIDPESEYYVGNIDALIEKTNQLIDYCRNEGFKIIFTRHVEVNSDTVFKDVTTATEIINKLHQRESDTIITKHKISPFYRTNLEQELGGIDHVVVAGILTNLCVRSFVQDAYDRDFQITVITDCCVAFDEDTQNFTFKDLKATREEIVFTELTAFLDPTGLVE